LDRPAKKSKTPAALRDAQDKPALRNRRDSWARLIPQMREPWFTFFVNLR
jgi:hypothetical protein